MKNKWLFILALAPGLMMAHPGHEHHVWEILTHPLSWANHGVVIGLIVLVVGVVLFRYIKKAGWLKGKAWAKK